MFTKTRLQQYFYGDDENQNDKLASNESNLVEVVPVGEDLHTSEPNLSRISSPASSLASTKKLEWDSGADIGYNNAYSSFKKSRKSKSYPSLNMDLSISKINEPDGQGDHTLTDNETTEHNKNSQSTSKSKSHEKKTKSIFTHSTPNEERIITKATSSTDSAPEKKCKHKDECLQTTLVNICSKSIQTDDKMVEDCEKVNKSQQTDTIKFQSSSSGSSLSKSSSFQYIPGSNKETSSSDKTPTESGISHLESSKSISKASNAGKSSTRDSKSSSTSPLGKIIATQQSTHLITDIDKSLQILNKFIKSKNYNSDTKRHYARKIVNKIITNKYSEDDTSLSSTNKSSEQPIEPNIINNDNKANIKPKTNSCGVQCDPIQKTVSTGTENKILNKKIEEIIFKNEKFIKESKDKSKSNLSNKSWKSDETVSEKLFEARRKSSSTSPDGIKTADCQRVDYIIQHSKNKKKCQLSWINNEISYLHKLKELLQKHDTSTNTSPSLIEELKSKSISGSQSLKVTPVASDKTKSLSQSSELQKSTTINSDIESRFYREFGSASSKSTASLKKTTNQKESLIGNDKKLHCPTCECCYQKSNNSKQSSEPSHKKTNSFNSHHNFYKNLIKPNVPKPEKNPEKSEAAIQCTLNQKKKRPPIRQIDSTPETTSTDYFPDKNNVQVFYKNSLSDTPSTEYGGIEITSQEPKGGKENQYPQTKHKNQQPKISKSSKPVAYFLTFEEESMKEFYEERLRPPLKNITVKVPKLNKTPKKLHSKPASKRKKNDDRVNEEGILSKSDETSDDGSVVVKEDKLQMDPKTLQDYLSSNRPDFVKSANWRRKMMSDQNEKKVRNIFTCAQMKKQTTNNYKKLPEVQNKIKTYKHISEQCRNRCMAQVFAKKLQKKTLKGEMSIPTCVHVMSPDS